MLRIPVKINAVNNLSDARFCAAMGVEMIGYSVSEGHARHLTVDKINGIVGWIAGIRTVAEGYSGESPEVLAELAQAISAEAIEIEAAAYKPSDFANQNLICRLQLADWEVLKDRLPSHALVHILVQKSDVQELVNVAKICAERETLLNVSQLDLGEIEIILKETNPYGISLDGGNELSPGLKDFEHLAEVLEYLEG